MEHGEARLCIVGRGRAGRGAAGQGIAFHGKKLKEY